MCRQGLSETNMHLNTLKRTWLGPGASLKGNMEVTGRPGQTQRGHCMHLDVTPTAFTTS